MHRSDLGYLAAMAGTVVFITAIVMLVVRPAFRDDVADVGTAGITSALIILSVSFIGMLREGRYENIERMVKEIYNHLGLGDASDGSGSHGGTPDGDARAGDWAGGAPADIAGKGRAGG